LSVLYLLNIGPDLGLPASLHSLHEAIDLSFSSSYSWSHQYLKKVFMIPWNRAQLLATA